MDGKPYRAADDPRTSILAQLLHDRGFVDEAKAGSRVSAIGLVISVLRWTAYNAPSGNLAVFAPAVLATAIEWEHEPQSLLELLQDAGFIDAQGQFINLQAQFAGQEASIRWMDS